MPKYEYVPLHVHTCFSPDGLGPVDKLIEYAAKNYRAMAVTDHGTLAGVAEFYKFAKEAGIKPIIGSEIYMSHNGKRGHLTVLSSGNVGFDSLVKLNNAAHQNLDTKGYPISTIEDLARFNDGLLVLSGCSSSPLYFGGEPEAAAFLGSLFDIFGRDRLFTEIMGVYHEDNVTLPMRMAKRFGLKSVVTTDSHFVHAHQAGAHKVMTQCRKGYDYSSQELYLKTGEELLQTSWFKGKIEETGMLELMRNTIEVADSITSPVLESAPTLPKATEVVELHSGYKDIFEIAHEAIPQYLEFTGFDDEPEKAKAAYERFEVEKRVMQDLGLEDYFTILYDIVRFCLKEGIKIGPGRGSGGGSFILFLLGITNVDPIENGLLFERFLSASRRDMADFDLDVDASRRDEVIEYAGKRWGAIPIANFATYSNASLVRDLGRLYKVPMEVTERAADLGDTDDDVLEEFFAYCKDSTLGSGLTITAKDARIAYNSMLGQVRHRGKHAGGVVICTRPVPVEGGVVAWTEGIKGRVLSMVGLVKYDILGVTALGQLAEMEDLTGHAPPVYFDDPAIFEIFQKGQTTGIFQFSGSQGIVKLTQQVAPQSLADLSAINALYRPGPLDSGMAYKFPDYKSSPRSLHPAFDAVLSETYGVIVYQEQVMALVALVTGGNLEEADEARKIISKGKVGDPVWAGKMRKLEEHFKDEGYKRFDRKLIDVLWSEIVTFGRYGFNKSHSTAYSVLAYQMAYYKLHFPGAFYTALLNSDQEAAEKWVYDAALHGVAIVPPHINKSSLKWVWDKVDNVVYAPLSLIKYFGEKGAAEVIRVREELGGVFTHLSQLKKVPKRSLNSRAMRLLHYADAFRGVAGDVGELIADYANLPVLSAADYQREAIGFVLPTETILEFLSGEQSSGRVVGFINEVEVRDKGKGLYSVYRLSPSGSFWTKDKKVTSALKVGDLVSAVVSDYGSGEKVRRKKL